MHHEFCPKCGSRLVPRAAGDDGDVPYCEQCGQYWFDSFACCVIILLANECGEVCLLRQSYLSSRYMTYVAGFIKPGESAEEAAAREVKEETGIETGRLDYAGTYWFADREQLMHGFVAFVPKQNFICSQEVDEARWVPDAEATSLMFPERPGNTQHPIFRRYLELKKERQAARSGT